MASEIEWKVVSTLNRTVLTTDDVTSPYLNARPNVGLFTQFGLLLKQSYIPLAVEPATGYYNLIQRRAKDSHCRFTEKKLPYRVTIYPVGDVTLSMSFRVFAPRILVASVRLRNLSKDLFRVPFDALFSLRNPKTIRCVGDLVGWSLDIINERNTPAASYSGECYTGFYFGMVEGNYWRDAQRQLVGLLIGNRDYQQMDHGIAESVERSSAEINKKSASEHLFVNKQGTIFLTSEAWTPTYPGNRLHRAMDLGEIALVYRTFLDKVYLEYRTEVLEDYLDYVYMRMKAWIESPEAVLNVSYTTTLHWNLLVREFGLREKIALLESQNPWLQEVLAGKSQKFANVPHEWWMSKQFASGLFNPPA